MMPDLLLVATIGVALLHLTSGLTSICVGVVACSTTDVLRAHSVSPIWSGIFFILTGLLGLACAKRRSSYLIMCFAALSVVSLVTAVVSIQLLRLGLLRKTVDGQTFQKGASDAVILVALVSTSCECCLCIVSSFISCRLAKAAKDELQLKREGTYHLSDDDTAVVPRVSHSARHHHSSREKFFGRSLTRI